MNNDLADVISGGLGSEPAHRDSTAVLAAGRQARGRRRRVRLSVVTVAVTLGVGAGVVGIDQHRNAQTLQIAEPTTSRQRTGSTVRGDDPKPLSGNLQNFGRRFFLLVSYQNGQLLPPNEFRVLDTVANPLHRVLPDVSVAWDLRWRGHEVWAIVDHNERGDARPGTGATSGSIGRPGIDADSFRDWVNQQS